LGEADLDFDLVLVLVRDLEWLLSLTGALSTSPFSISVTAAKELPLVLNSSSSFRMFESALAISLWSEFSLLLDLEALGERDIFFGDLDVLFNDLDLEREFDLLWR